MHEKYKTDCELLGILGARRGCTGAAGEPGATEAATDGRGVSAGPAAPCLLPLGPGLALRAPC